MNFLNQILKTYKQGLAYEGLFKSFEDLLKVVSTEREQFTSAINDLEEENLLLHSDLDNCKSNDENIVITPEVDIQELIANMKKVTKDNPYKYPFKGDGKKYDIKFSLTVKDMTLVTLYGNKIFNTYKPVTPLDCVESVSKYFLYNHKPTYKSERVDVWAPADEFLETWSDDCDSTAITMHVLIKYLLDKTGNSEHYGRLYLHINDNYLEGHANNLWLADDGYFYTIESTIDPKGTFNRKWLHTPLAFDSFYKKTRGIANLYYSTTGRGNTFKNYLK